MTKDPKRYDIENIPISPETGKALGDAGIYVLGAVGRMLLRQDEVYDQEFTTIKESLARIEKGLKKKCLDHERRLQEIEAKLAS
jgi:hypothetical protein